MYCELRDDTGKMQLSLADGVSVSVKIVMDSPSLVLNCFVTICCYNLAVLLQVGCSAGKLCPMLTSPHYD